MHVHKKLRQKYFEWLPILSYGYTRMKSGKIDNCLILRLFSFSFFFLFAIISNTDEYQYFD